MSWSKRFREPVPLADGRKLLTLHDARSYILDLAKSDQKNSKWETAAEALLHAAEHGGAWLDLARIGMMQALNTEEPRWGPGKREAKEVRWGRRAKFARDR